MSERSHPVAPSPENIVTAAASVRFATMSPSPHIPQPPPHHDYTRKSRCHHHAGIHGCTFFAHELSNSMVVAPSSSSLIMLLETATVAPYHLVKLFATHGLRLFEQFSSPATVSPRLPMRHGRCAILQFESTTTSPQWTCSCLLHRGSSLGSRLHAITMLDTFHGSTTFNLQLQQFSTSPTPLPKMRTYHHLSETAADLAFRHFQNNHRSLRAATHDSQTLMERETTLTRGSLSMDYQRVKTNQPVNSRQGFGQQWSNRLFLQYFWQVVPLQEP